MRESSRELQGGDPQLCAYMLSPMVISDLQDLPLVPERAVIINAGTKCASTLALLSTLRHVRTPVLMIDCESKDGSAEWFRTLMQRHAFDLMTATLRPHGETLDWLFARIPAERVLLVDSDVEVLSAEMLGRMRSLLVSSDDLYGAGYLHPPAWLERHYGTDWPLASGIGYYMERMWIPFVLLRVSPIQEALRRGSSFMHRVVLNDAAPSSLLSGLLWRRFRLPYFRRHRLSWLDPLRKAYDGQRPCYVFYDTGARLHEFLVTNQRLSFDGVSPGAVPWSVTHFAGVTRSVLSVRLPVDAHSLLETNGVIAERLSSQYGVTLPES